jgi:[acyl-carrier-protein] S-malonyltransferase
MKQTALMFPGQGSQYVGMGKDWYEAEPLARELFDSADRLLGFPLSALCFNGPEEELRQTRNTQPAIFVHSVMVATILKPPDIRMAAGHSLGEYSALVVAGAMSFEDGLALVRLRGELMQRAGEERKGTMAAIVGLSNEELETLCAEASKQGIVQPANFNSLGQVVISGTEEGVRKAMEIAKLKGAKLAKELVVSGAFHSPLMERAKGGLKEALAETTIRNPDIPVYANVTGEPMTTVGEIRDLLYRQLTSPVRWEQTIQHMVRDGVTHVLEVGPGKVLQGLAKRTAPAIAVSGVDKYGQLREFAGA